MSLTRVTQLLLVAFIALCVIAPWGVESKRRDKKNANRPPKRSPYEGLNENQAKSARVALDEDSITPEIHDLLMRGDAFMQNQKNFDQAMKFYGEAELAYRRLPSFVEPFLHIEILTRVGRVYSNIGRDCDAIPWFDQAAVLRPNDGMIYYSQAITYSNCNRDREAIQIYQTALMYNIPDHEETSCKYMMAKSHLHVGQFAKAIEGFQEVRSRDRWFPDIDLMLGLALERSGARAKAIPHYNITVRRSEKSDIRGHLRLGAALTKLGRQKQAKEFLKKVVAQDENLARFYNTKPVSLHPALVGHKQVYQLDPVNDDGEPHPNQLKTYRVTPLYPTNEKQLARQATGEYVGPTLFYVDNFLDPLEAKTIQRIFDQAHATRSPDPLTCFARTEKLDQLFNQGKLFETKTLTDGLAESQECVNATESLLKDLKYSTSTFIHHDEHPLIDEIHLRIERVLGLNHSHGASTQLLKYGVDEEYYPHTDCAVETRVNDRAITVLIYLNDVSEGGATAFPRLNMTVEPKLGRLVVFTSLDQEGYCDILSEHASTPVKEGTKYVVQKWYHSEVQNMKVQDLFRHARKKQSVLNCDGTNSCREYIQFRPSVISKDTRIYPSPQKKAKKADATEPAAPAKDEL